MARFTKKNLEAEIDKVNQWLDELGTSNRVEMGARNGYYAVDEYPVDANNNRIGSSVNRSVGTGSPRECDEALHTYYGHEVRRVNEVINETARKFTVSVVETIKGGCSVDDIRAIATELGLI